MTRAPKTSLFRPVCHVVTHGSNLMLKKVFLAAAVSLLMVGVTLTAAPTEGYAGKKSHCLKQAKAKYADDRKARRAYKKECKTAYKATQKA